MSALVAANLISLAQTEDGKATQARLEIRNLNERIAILEADERIYQSSAHAILIGGKHIWDGLSGDERMDLFRRFTIPTEWQ
jgi:hypothetical protein